MADQWWQRAVFYQIYPRSFADSNGDGIGDLPGITAHLEQLAGTPDSLGVDAIWISPFYRSPMADFGYDISDYRDVDPSFGTLADFDALLARAHELGLRVIVDFVPNHTSDRHPWFVDARSTRNSAHRDWYVWADPAADGGPPNNWRSHFMGKPAWTLDPVTGQYYLHLFLAEQPDLNWWNPAVRAEIEDSFRFWLERGVDGFRIDVAHLLLKDADLRNNPAPLPPVAIGGRMDEDQPEVHEIHRSWRRLFDEYGAMAVGEVYILDPARMVRYYGEANDELHLAFNFAFLRQPWEAEAFRESADAFEALLPDGAWPDYTLSNHDVPRARSRYDSADGGGRGAVGLARARVAAMMLLTLRGTPFIYYGEEIGQANGTVPPERVVDMDGRDPERTPMQWEPGPGAGFTGAGVEPWLPIGPDADACNVAIQRDDPASMFSLYRDLLRLRRGSRALLNGSYRSLDPAGGAPAGMYAYVREAGNERLLVLLNFTSGELTFDGALAALPDSGRLELSTDPRRRTGEAVGLRPLNVGPDEGVIVRL